ncbi:hypothetical protein SESBI_24277 [Sesbania bispinosa]|nr:hypothetical protein SESBI_24277 [Sesbania bispinosa]
MNRNDVSIDTTRFDSFEFSFNRSFERFPLALLLELLHQRQRVSTQSLDLLSTVRVFHGGGGRSGTDAGGNGGSDDEAVRDLASPSQSAIVEGRGRGLKRVHYYCSTSPDSDDQILTEPCSENEKVCDSYIEGHSTPLYTYLYDTFFIKLHLQLPFSNSEKQLLNLLNISPSQLHPNSWAFIQAYQIIAAVAWLWAQNLIDCVLLLENEDDLAGLLELLGTMPPKPQVTKPMDDVAMLKALRARDKKAKTGEKRERGSSASLECPGNAADMHGTPNTEVGSIFHRRFPIENIVKRHLNRKEDRARVNKVGLRNVGKKLQSAGAQWLFLANASTMVLAVWIKKSSGCY